MADRSTETPVLDGLASVSLEKLIVIPDSATQTSVWVNRKCFLYCGAMYLAAFFTSYEQITANGFLALPAFIDKFGSTHPNGTKYISTGLQQGMFLSIDGGSLLALAIIWYIYDYIGRIRVLQLGLVATICGIFLATWAPNAAVFITARVFWGISVGCVHSAAFLWVGESAVAHIRSMSSAFYGLKTALGSTSAALVCRAFSHGTSPRHYQIPLLIGVAPTLLSLALTFLIPESPRWYALQGRYEDARRTLRTLRPRSLSDELIDAELTSMRTAVEWEIKTREATSSRLKEVFHRRNLRRTALAMANGLIYVAGGTQFVGSGSAYLLKAMGAKDPFKYQAIMKSAMIPAAGISYFTADGLPRRVVLLLYVTISLCAMVGLGVVSTVSLTTDQRVPASTAFMALGIFGYYAGGHVVIQTQEVEIPQQSLRSLTYSLTAALSIITAAINNTSQPHFINTDAMNWGGKYAFIWAGSCVLCLIYVYLFAPETRNVTLEEIDLLFESQVPPRRFQHFVKEHRRKVANEISSAAQGQEMDEEKGGVLVQGGGQSRVESPGEEKEIVAENTQSTALPLVSFETGEAEESPIESPQKASNRA